MIHDAKAEITCDGGNCGPETIEVELEYVYRTYSGNSGQYDDSEESINRKVRAQGWSANGDVHFCEYCQSEGES